MQHEPDEDLHTEVPCRRAMVLDLSSTGHTSSSARIAMEQMMIDERVWFESERKPVERERKEIPRRERTSGGQQD